MPARTPGGLPPLLSNLTPEARALTNLLRERFEQLRISPRAYGRMHDWDAEAIEGFLCGDQIPPQEFIDTLLADAGSERSTEEVDNDHTQFTHLREKALQTADARTAEQERLERELSRVQNVIRLAEARERDLSSQLAERETEYDVLRRNYEELKAAQRAAATGPRQLESYQPKLREIDRDRGETQKEIQRLNKELSKEQALRAEAEQKRDELRAELDRARVMVHQAGGSIPYFGHYTPPAFTILRSKTVWPLLATGSMLAFYCAFYLGLVYRVLSSQQMALKVLTISWLTLPAFILTIMARVGHGEFRHSFRFLTSAALLTLALFFIGTLI